MLAALAATSGSVLPPLSSDNGPSYRRRAGTRVQDEKNYPRHFGSFPSYQTEIKDNIAARYPLPGWLTLDRLDAFLASARNRYRVEWIDQAEAGDGREGDSADRGVGRRPMPAVEPPAAASALEAVDRDAPQDQAGA